MSQAALRSSCDVIIVGSGGAGLAAAHAASSAGADAVIVERGTKFGGSTSLSGGQLWIPNNRYQKRKGVRDSEAMATKYLTRLARGRGDPSMIEAFVRHSPKALDFVVRNTPLRLALRDHLPDYHPEWEGGVSGGRTIDTGLFDGETLGPEYPTIHQNPKYHLPGALHTTSLE